MKKLLILILMMTATMTVSAQQNVGSLSIIPKVGVNLANLAGDVEDNSIKLGLAFGAEAMYQIAPTVGLSGGLIYSMQGCEGEGDLKLNINEVNIPILVNFYVAKGLALKLGLQPGIITSAKTKYEKAEYDVKDNCKSIELSLPFGISYEISDFVIDGRYNFGLTKMNKEGDDIRNSVFQITLGYKIPM